MKVRAGSTNVSIAVHAIDANGNDLNSLTESDIDGAYWFRDGAVAATEVTLVSSSGKDIEDPHEDGLFVKITTDPASSPADIPGWYRLDMPDNVWTDPYSGARPEWHVHVKLTTSSGQFLDRTIVVVREHIPELAAPPDTSSMDEFEAIAFLAMERINDLQRSGTEASGTQTVKNNAGTAIAEATVTNDGSTVTKGKYATP